MERQRKPIEFIGTRLDRQQEAYNMFYMSPEDRHALGRAIDAEPTGRVADYSEARKIMDEAYIATVMKLHGIGLTLPQYHGAYESLAGWDIDAVKQLKELSAARMNEARGRVVTTKDMHKDVLNGGYKPERLYFHHKLVQEKLSPLTPEEKPVIIFLVGTPGTGKTALRTQETGFTRIDGDEVKFSNFAVTDPDALRPDVLPGFDGTSGEDVYKTQEEVFDLSTEILEEALRRRLNIVCETTLRTSGWVLDTLAAAGGYRSKMILIHTPLEECFRRTVAWRARAASIPFLLSAMQGYENFFELSAQDRVDEALVLETDGKDSTRREVYRKEKGGPILANQERVAAITQYGEFFKQAA